MSGCKAICLLPVLTLISALMSPAWAQRPVFVDAGACPGEGCTYGVWRTAKPLPLRPIPTDSATENATAPEGELVCALTGEVHTTPGHFLVMREHGRFAPGDTIFVLTYRGEGWFLVEYRGAQLEEELGFSPWGGTAGSRCERGPDCWGVLQEPLEFDWWVRVDNLRGTVGWVLEDQAFDKLIPRTRDPEFFAECRRRRDPGFRTVGEASAHVVASARPAARTPKARWEEHATHAHRGDVGTTIRNRGSYGCKQPACRTLALLAAFRVTASRPFRQPARLSETGTIEEGNPTRKGFRH